jgi:hypothetical protein
MRTVQPNHQIIQEQIGIDGNGNIMAENAAAPSATPSKVIRIGARNVVGYCAHRRMLHLYGEAQFVPLASAAVYRSAAPKECALRDDRQGAPILFILNERLRAPPAQVQMNDF